MRIAVDIRSLIEAFPSGVSQYVYQIVKHLLAVDQENQYLLFYNSFSRKIADELVREFDRPNVQIIRWRWPNKIMNFLLLAGLFGKLDKRLGGVDVFFMPNLHFADWSEECRSVITVHDLSFLYPDFFSAKRRFWHRFVQPLKKLTKADKIIAVSESTKSDILNNLNISDGNIKVIYSGVDQENVKKKLNNLKGKDIADKFNLKNPYFLFIGNIERRKNVSGIIQAWQLLQREKGEKVDLVMAGNILDKKIKDEVAEVKFLDYVTDDEKYYLLKQACALVYPSYYEGFGLPIIEALAVGCPVITSHATALPEIASQGALIVDPYNIQAIKQAMHQILSEPGLRERLKDQGKRIADQYTWLNSAKLLLEVFKSL